MKNSEFLIVAVKDELVEAYMTPQFFGSEKEAIRIFTHQINTIPLWKQNASDYSLYKIGYFNEITGEIKGEYSKIISGHSVLKREEKE